MKTTTLSPELILNKKKEAINNQTLRRECPLGHIKLIDDQRVTINGHTIEITKNAYKSLIKSIGLPQGFINKLEKLFTKESKLDFISTLQKAIELSNDTTIVNVHLSQQSKCIIGFSTGQNTIHNKTFINFADNIIDEHGFSVVDIWNDPYTGGTSINCIINNTHEVKGLSNEAFTTGLNISNDPMKGITVAPYINRLWCANGCTTQMANESYKLNELTPQSQDSFYKHLNELRKTGFIPSGYGDLVRNANNTSASIAELNRVKRQIEPLIGERANTILQMAKNEDAYKKMGFDVNLMDSDTKRMAKSNQSIWSLTNALTWVATNSDKTLDVNIQDSDRQKLQIEAGNLLSKKWDHQNALTNPFGDLNPDEQTGLILN